MDDPPDRGAFQGRFHRIGTDLSVTTVETGVGVSNSLAFAPDGTTMYWADTRRGRIEAFDYDVESGERANGRVFVDFAGRLPGAPDGACVDTDGCLWVACVYGWGLARITPRGEVDRFVELPVEKPSMPAFGGPRLDTLFVTSISSGGSRAAAPGQPLAGAVLVLDVGGTGLAEPRFAG
jgi:sugar lactone lactonase YvrE